MLENLISDSAVKYRNFISSKKNLLNLDYDIGAILADSKEDAEFKLNSLINNKIKLFSPNDIKYQSKIQKRKSFYIIGKYGQPKTWKVGDCLRDGQ